MRNEICSRPAPTDAARSGRAALRAALGLTLAWLLAPAPALAQDLEPRRWTHLPVGANVVGLTYAYIEGDVAFDPLLEVEQATVTSHATVASYARSFDLFGKTGRLDVIAPYQWTRWEGLLSGAPASRERQGLADPWVRLSVLLLGAPALAGQDYLAYRAAHPVQTVVGAALAVALPLGDYQEDRLLNLGQNRFTFRPQVGVVHTRGPWSYELTGSVYLYTDNDEFFGGNRLAQDPLWAIQGHVIRGFPSGMWGSLSAGHGFGGESTVNGQAKDDPRDSLLFAASAGLPIGRTQGLKLAYLRGDRQRRVGSDTQSLVLSWNLRF